MLQPARFEKVFHGVWADRVIGKSAATTNSTERKLQPAVLFFVMCGESGRNMFSILHRPLQHPGQVLVSRLTGQVEFGTARAGIAGPVLESGRETRQGFGRILRG